MKLWTIFRFELITQVRSFSTGFYAAVLLGFTVLMNGLVTPGEGVFANNTFHIIAVTVMGSVIWLLMAAAKGAEAAARDVQVGMHPLVYTTPVAKHHYLGGRFAAALTVNALLVLLLPVGILLSFYLPGAGGEQLQPFRLSAYANAYFLVALPNAFIATALQFSFAALSRKVMAGYLASLVLVAFPQLIAITTATLFGNWDLLKLLDPVGMAGIISSELGTWTATEKNTKLLSLEGMFLWNRVLWMGIAAGMLLLTYARFSAVHPVNTRRWPRLNRAKEREVGDTVIFRRTSFSLPQFDRNFDFATCRYQVRTIAWASFKRIARNPVGLTLVGAIAVASAVLGSRIMTQFTIPMLPATAQVIDYLTAPVGNISTAWVVIPLLLMYFAGELVWHERDARLSAIADAAPVPDWALLAGRFLGLALVIVAWMAILMVGGIAMQWGLNYDNWEAGLYLKALFGLQLWDYLLFALLALVVHVVVNQKYVGYAVMLLVFCYVAFPSSFGIEHNLLIWGASPGWWYTDMRGFGATIVPWLWFKAYWIAWSLALAVAARLLWARGRDTGLKYRMMLAKHRFKGATRRVAIIAAGLITATGSFIFYNTNVLNGYATSADINERKATYEQRYGRYRNIPQPQLTRTKLHVEIYPDRQQVDIRAVYTLVNREPVMIDSIHIGNLSGTQLREVALNRPHTAALVDHELSHYIYALRQPLAPGDSLQLNFVVQHQPRGFQHSAASPLVVEGGTYFTNFDLLPSIGYQRFRELQDAVTRQKFGLTARPALPSLYDSAARKKGMSTDRDAFEAIVGTAGDEVAVAPGRLHRTWTEGSRRYYHFKTDAPIGGEYSILSGKYAVLEDAWENVVIRMYYHPGHARNITRMLESVKMSMQYYTEQFGPYPFGHFTVVERGGTEGGLSAEATMVDYGEPFSLLNADTGPGGFDLPYYVVAHEVAHQWWGGASLRPAMVEGVGFLIEGLAVYSGMQVLENKYGEAHAREFLQYLHSFYEAPRSRATASLLQANDPFLYYRKGGLAMYVLHQYVGKKEVNAALRELLQSHRSGALPLPTTLDLYRQLQKVTPDSLHYLLHDLFEKNMYWRLKAKQMTARQTVAGDWEVTLTVQADKLVIDSTGGEREVPMADWLEVGLFEKDKMPAEPLYLRKHRIRSGVQTIKLTVPRKPDSGGIDPNFLMIDLRLEDNVVQLSGE